MHQTMPIQGVILDMDGVLVDSEPLIKAAAAKMFAGKGYTVQLDDFNPFVGTGEDHFLGGVAEKYGIPLDAERDKAKTYEIYLQLIPGRLKALPGVHEFVRRCRQRRLRLALASSADAVKVKGNLHEIGLPLENFDAVVDGNDVARKKPDPEIFLAARAKLGLPALACLVVEDAIAGVAAAKAAGMRCLALTTSFSRELLREADWIAPTLAQVPPEVFAAME